MYGRKVKCILQIYLHTVTADLYPIRELSKYKQKKLRGP
jgi:hypothetical protein